MAAFVCVLIRAQNKKKTFLHFVHSGISNTLQMFAYLIRHIRTGINNKESERKQRYARMLAHPAESASHCCLNTWGIITAYLNVLWLSPMRQDCCWLVCFHSGRCISGDYVRAEIFPCTRERCATFTHHRQNFFLTKQSSGQPPVWSACTSARCMQFYSVCVLNVCKCMFLKIACISNTAANCKTGS